MGETERRNSMCVLLKQERAPWRIGLEAMKNLFIVAQGQDVGKWLPDN